MQTLWEHLAERLGTTEADLLARYEGLRIVERKMVESYMDLADEIELAEEGY
jgi:hypothetical protein